MRITSILFALCVGLAPAAVCAAPLEAYGRLPAIEAVALSPDGERMAVVTTNGESRRIVVRTIKPGTPDVVARAGEIKLRDIAWADSNYLLVTTSSSRAIDGVVGGRFESQMVQVLNTATGRARSLLNYDMTTNVVLGEPQVRVLDGETYALLTALHFPTGQAGRAGLFKVKLSSGKTFLVEPGGRDTRQWAVGPTGEPLAATEWSSETGESRLVVRQGREWRVVKAAEEGADNFSLFGLGRSPNSILVAEDQGETSLLREYDVVTGAWGAPLEVEGADDALYQPGSYLLMGLYALAGDDERFSFFDARNEKIWKAVTAAYPGQRVRLVSTSANMRRVVVHVDSPTDGPGYAFVDLDAHSADWIGDAYPDVKAADVAPVQAVTYKAADGMALSGYLTLPRGRAAKGLPLVVLPHGGPVSRDRPGFDWWAQGLASRGYAVLQVNFRGSGGFGRALREAGYGEWGRKMQTDLSDGVRHLAAQGLVDPKRVCIVGASYGGYAALAGATLDPGVYRCAASVAGVSDLPDMLAWVESRSGDAGVRRQLELLGGAAPNDPALLAISPVKQAAKAQVPILLIHGRDDTVVPIRQSRAMEAALRKAGKPVEFVELKGEDHWLSQGDTRVQMLKSIADFLERYNPPS